MQSFIVRLSLCLLIVPNILSAQCGGINSPLYVRLSFLTSETISLPSHEANPETGVACPDNTTSFSRYRLSFYSDPAGLVPVAVAGLRIGFEPHGGLVAIHPEQCVLPGLKLVPDTHESLLDITGSQFETDLVYDELINYWNGTCGSDNHSRYFELVTSCGNLQFVTEVLPVRFDQVQGRMDRDGKARIIWTNLTETHIRKYLLERSVGGSPLVPVAEVLPQSNNGGRASYTLTDLPPSGPGALLYRIRAIEFSGEQILSPVIRLSYSPGLHPGLRVYPNPVTSETIQVALMNIPSGRYALLLQNLQSREEFLEWIWHPGGDMTRALTLRKPAAGLYILHLRSPERTYSKTLSILPH